MLDFTLHTVYKKIQKIMKNALTWGNWSFFSISGLPSEYQKLLFSNLCNHAFLKSDLKTDTVKRYIQTLKEISIDKIKYFEFTSLLSQFGFKKVDRLSKKKEFCIRGDTITLWPSVYASPIKIVFFDENVDNIEIFDQSLNKKIITIKYILVGKETILAENNYPIELLNPEKETKRVVFFFDQYNLKSNLNFDFIQPRLFFQRFDLLDNYIFKYSKKNFKIYIQTKHKESIPSKLQRFIINTQEFPSGIISNELKILVLTDREIFGTIFLTTEISKSLSSTESRKVLAQFEGEVNIGEYVVHEDHGIGIYEGLVQERPSEYYEIENNYIKIRYKEGDELLVPLNMIYKITKYIGIDGRCPELSRLDKIDWIRITQKAKTSIYLLASELLRHYAKISLSKANVINKGDTDLYSEFVSQFEYEETEDQLRSINEINKDLEKDKPMNRLLVGDVGFGKTEVIMRAAFKTVEVGKQVAILAPTTVLTAQHYKVFRERFRKFPFSISMLSRFQNKYDNKDIIKKLKQGEIDIIIGTHRLLSNDVEFKDLGLLVIDEEQRFGVKQKEKLKKLKYGVHVLSTTATPIPRTLSMALSSIQDISTIQTPPKGRKPIKTNVKKIDWNQIINAIEFEKRRNGQVYFVYNSVRKIYSIESKLKSLLPNITFAVAHGQMNPEKLDLVMTNFIEKKYDVLISTTIIENGIDMKNVNTMIVMKAQNFGLSQLYQLRGRIGRSDRQAYAYFFYDGKNIEESEEKHNALNKNTKDYIKRLKALKDAKELGAGFDIATKDLEIRGAGNLLGREQHGNINKIGFGLYMQLLTQEIEKQKNDK